MPDPFNDSTSPTLLRRLRNRGDQEAWRRFIDLYTPFLVACTRRLGVAEADLADRVQDLLAHLFEKLPTFEYDPRLRFRGWLWRVVRNKVRDWQRGAPRDGAEGAAHADLSEWTVPDPLDEWAEAEYHRQLIAQILTLIQNDFAETTWRAFWETVYNGRATAEVAQELNLSVAAVYQAKCRVLQSLRREFKEVDE